MQLVVLMPLMFAAMFVGVQAAVWHHARTIAFAAAQEGVTAAAGEGGSVRDGDRRRVVVRPVQGQRRADR